MNDVSILTDQNLAKEREAFEKWLGPQTCRSLHRDEVTGEYAIFHVELQWQVWIARAALDKMPPMVDLPVAGSGNVSGER